MKEINEFLYLILHIHHLKQFLRYKVRISIKEGKNFLFRFIQDGAYRNLASNKSVVINVIFSFCVFKFQAIQQLCMA